MPSAVLASARCKHAKLFQLANSKRNVRLQSFQPSHQGETPSLMDLQRQLDEAVSHEDFREAARLRDHIAEAASFKEMDKIWGDGESVQCIHPGMPALSGRDKVIASWKLIFRGRNNLDVRISNVKISVVGNMGFVTCEEHVETDSRQGYVAATNVFEKQGDTWKIVHHHGSIVTPTLKVVS